MQLLSDNSCDLKLLLLAVMLPLTYCLGSVPGNVMAAEQYMKQIPGNDNNQGQVDAVEQICDTFAISKVVPEQSIDSFDEATQLKIRTDTATIKRFLKSMSIISKNAMSGQYTEQEMIKICKALTKLQSKVLKANEIGSVNIELQNMVSLLQCGLTYLILSNPGFNDYSKLNYLDINNYPNHVISPGVFKQICSQEGKHIFEREFVKEEDVLIDAIKGKYPGIVEAYKKEKNKQDLLTASDIIPLYLYYLENKKGSVIAMPLNRFDPLDFAMNYYTTEKNVLLARLSVFYVKIKKEETELSERNRRFKKELFENISEKEKSLYVDTIQNKGDEAMQDEVLSDIRQNIGFKGGHILKLVHNRCLFLAGEDSEKMNN